MGVPDKGSACYQMGLKWMKECLLCERIHEGGDDSGDEENYCEQYPSASEVQHPGASAGGQWGGYPGPPGPEPVGDVVTFWVFPVGLTGEDSVGVQLAHDIADCPIGPILPPPVLPIEPGHWSSRFPGCTQKQMDALTRGLHSALLGMETRECCEMLPERWARRIMECMREKLLTASITCLRPGDKYYKRCLQGHTAFAYRGRIYVCRDTLKNNQLGGSFACQLAGTLAEELAHLCGLEDPGFWQSTAGALFGLPTAGDYGACIESACYTIEGVSGGVL